ncbi:MAG: histidine phosphatase family protein [Chloroflexi bacterium]|nr:histidine phosphatase family protein [Chloroflexota bacterium]
MATIYLVRHGQSQANVERVFSNGRVDLPLTDLGYRQAGQAAAWLDGRNVRRVYASPLLRARQTAAVIAERLDVPVEVLVDLDEIRVGDLDGRRDGRSWTLHDTVLGRWRAGDRAARFPGGESYGEAYDRFSKMLQQIAVRHAGEAVVAVTHGAIVGTVVPRLCPTLWEDVSQGKLHWSLQNAAITTLEVAADGVSCSAWGYVGHVGK